MKRILLSSLILIGFTMMAQRENSKNLFSKGTTHLDLSNFRFKYGQMTNDDADPLTMTNMNLRLRGNYFVTDKFAVVAGIQYRTENEKSEADNPLLSSSSSKFKFKVGAQYGFYAGDLPLMAEARAGFGNEKQEQSGGSQSTVGVTDLNVNISTFFPVDVLDMHVKLTAGYNGTFENESEFDLQQNYNGGYIQAGLIKAINPCQQFTNPCAVSEPFESKYDRGTNQLELSQRGKLSFGGTSLTQGGQSIGKDGNIQFNVRLADYYYPVKRVAVGAGIRLSSSSDNDQDSDFQRQTSRFTFTPMVRAHVPVDGKIENLFLEAGGIFGNRNTVTKFGGNTPDNENFTTISGWDVGLGYNMPFSDNLMLTGIFHYISETEKNAQNNSETKNDGWRFSIGLGYNF